MHIPLKLIQSIEQVKDSSRAAVFDADGTLWPSDLGYDFFHYQMKKKLIKKPLWADQFNELYHSDPKKICAQIVQCNKGVLLSEYISWFQSFLKEHPLNVFSFQKELLEKLSQLGIQVFVISASPEWLVKEAVLQYRLPVQEVIGIRSEVIDDKITDKLIHPLSIKEGKVEAFLKNNSHPFLSSSNSISDLALMECATHIKWVVALAKKGERQYLSEQKLLNIAKEKGWFYIG